MSYNNRFNLRFLIGLYDLEKPITRSHHLTFCKKCNSDLSEVLNSKYFSFCPHCGNKLIKDIDLSNNEERNEFLQGVIKEFRLYSEEAAFLIGPDGKSNEPGSGYKLADNLKEFSKNYPKITFQLDIQWDGGFADLPSRYFYQDGKVHEAKVEITYEKFDKTKLKP
jgi:predicted RNA-binding Zn-ribbon protein involved in translation (DUF1610 family)